ncbi:MAG: hypothetical protein N2688_13235 [Burkholderiaceae bacterium]|nr:hypothetical protein [Burkholderiaceae bacterium]
MLAEYRRSFRPAYENVVDTLRQQLGLEVTGRPEKTVNSIVAKLRRERVRLSQMQDIAGCRIVVPDIPAQVTTLAEIGAAFPSAKVYDRRSKPSHGYRAVHVVVHVNGKAVEIQIRTELQDLWAQISEQLSDVWDPELKYGKGSAKARKFLLETSALVENVERLETPSGIPHLFVDPETAAAREWLTRQRERLKREITDMFDQVLQDLTKARERR